MGITLDDIDAAEGAVKNVRVALSEMGREIYKLREGDALGSQYAFERYARSNFSGPNYCDQEGPDWGVGTPIISLIYYWSRAESSICVTLPQSYLVGDWRALEAERIAAECKAIADKRAHAAQQAALAREESDRREFERLRAKFATPPTAGEE